MVDAIVRFYKWSPVICNAIIAGLVLLLYQVVHMLGGPEVDFKWLIGILMPGYLGATFKSVTSPATIAKREGPDGN